MNLEKLARQAEKLNGKAHIAFINNAFRAEDESHKWPINGKFDATERAIRRLRRIGYDMQGLEYCYALDAEITRIVVKEV